MFKQYIFFVFFTSSVFAIPKAVYFENFSKVDTKYSKEISKSANKYIGVPYVWGGNSLVKGLDCSAFVKILIKEHTNIDLPRTAKNQALKTKKCSSIKSFSNLKVGDAIYFKNNRGHIHHVALITGFDKDGFPFITHAKGKKYGVVREKISQKYIDEFFIGKRFSSCKRYKALLIKNQ